jgi:hypothetical protein
VEFGVRVEFGEQYWIKRLFQTLSLKSEVSLYSTIREKFLNIAKNGKVVNSHKVCFKATVQVNKLHLQAPDT